MSETKAPLEDLIESRMNMLSFINEPIVDFAVDFTVEPKTAVDRARRRWGMEPERHE